MKSPTIQTVLAWCLIGFFAAPFQVSCIKTIPFGMAWNSVDDQYLGCEAYKEAKLQQPGYLPVPTKYWANWQNARLRWAALNHAGGYFNPLRGTAVMAYSIGGSMYVDFTSNGRQAGQSQHSYNQYAFKDFHYLLTQAVKSRKIPGKCYEVFRGIRGIHFTVYFKKRVRFGQFASSSLNKKVAQMFGQDTLFSIRTCHGAPIYDLSAYPHHLEVLIPPYERFAVTHHTKDSTGVKIRLESRGVYSRLNCGKLKGH